MTTAQIERPLVLRRIGSIIGAVVGQPELVVSDTTRAEQVRGWDSLAHVSIVLNVEKAYGMRLKAAEVARLENVGSLVDIVLARGKLCVIP